MRFGIAPTRIVSKRMAFSRHVNSDLRDRQISSQLGTFWIPDQPGVLVHGVVDIDADGISLRLHGRLRPDREPATELPDHVIYPVVHGSLENPSQQCTLLSVWCWFEFTRYTALDTRICVRGAHVAEDEPVSRVRLQFDGSHILSPESFRVEFPTEVADDDSGVRSVHITKAETMRLDMPGVALRIRPDISFGGGIKSIEMLRVASITAELDPPRPLGEAVDGVHLPMRHLLAVLRGSTAELLSVQMLAASGELSNQNLATGELPLDVDIPHLAARGAHLDLARNQYLFDTFEARDFGPIDGDPATALKGLIRAWFHAFGDETIRRACDAANRTAPASARTEVQLFADYFAAMEILAGELEPDGQAHEARVDQLMSWIPTEEVGRAWADDRLRSSGQWGTKTALAELTKVTPFADKFVDSESIAECNSSRGDYSHGGALDRNALRMAALLRGWFVVRVLQLGGADTTMLERFATRMANRLK